MPIPIYSQLRLNEIRQKSSHNTYDCNESFIDQILFWRIHSIEIDIWRKNSDGEYPPDNGWWVYHANCQKDNPCPMFSTLLRVLGGIHNQFLNHEIITVFLEIKDGFDATDNHWVTDLDRFLGERFIQASGLPSDVIFSPDDLAKNVHPAHTLREALASAGWPNLVSLQNKFMFILTGGNEQMLLYENTIRVPGNFPQYAFTAPELFDGDTIDKYPDAIIYNFNSSLIKSFGNQVNANNLIGRAYGVDGISDWKDGVSNNVHHLATAVISIPSDPQNGVFFTNNKKGWPFQLLSGQPNEAANESFDTYDLKVGGGSIRGKSDSCMYVYADCSSRLDRNYHYLISARQSHELSIGALMCRENPNESTARCLVISWGNKKNVGVYIRTAANGNLDLIAEKTYTEDELRKVTTVFLKVEIDNGGSHIIVASSIDLIVWEKVYSGSIDPALCKFQGIALSSGVDNEQAYYAFGGETDPYISFDNTATLGLLSKPDPIFLKNTSPPFDGV